MAKNITVIPATIDRFTDLPLTTVKKRKVAAYARVSTDVAHSKDEVQLSNYELNMFYIMLRSALAVDFFQYEW